MGRIVTGSRQCTRKVQTYHAYAVIFYRISCVSVKQDYRCCHGITIKGSNILIKKKKQTKKAEEYFF